MRQYLFILAFCFVAISAIAQRDNGLTFSQEKLINRADSLINRYKFQQALDVLAKGDSLNTDILSLIGQCNFRLGISGAAIRPYKRILRMDSSNVNALNQLGQLYARDGDFAKALSSFEHLIKLDATNSYYCKQAGLLASRLDDTMKAKLWLRKALVLNPSDMEASLTLGNIQLDLEEYQSVDSITQQALAIDPQYKPLLVLRAKSAFEQQQYESVIITLNNLLERSDTTALYARLLGISYFNLKEYSKLVTCMSFLLKNRYEQEWIYYYMGVSMRELGDAAASVHWLKLAAQKSISENTKVYYTHLGQSYEEMGDYLEAIRAYRIAYDYSKEGILLYHLARNYDVYYKDKATALAYYRKYLASEDTIRLTREYARKRMQDMGDF